jgi:sugar phosphate isomerase/epimerase
MAPFSRRGFLSASAATLAAAPFAGLGCGSGNAARSPEGNAPKGATGELFKISLAEWSLHRALFAKTIDHLDFPKIAKTEFGIDAVEYVNQFFKDKATDAAYIGQMKKRCDDLGVRSVLIMCDDEGRLGDPDAAARRKAVENHHKWVDAAKTLGCHSVRVNASSDGSYDEQVKLAADGLRRLSEFGATRGLNVIVENHGGLSSNGAWLAAVMKTVNLPNCGTLPDFGNFRVSETEEYDRYKGVDELMPFAKGVSAKSHDFDAEGNETHTDYFRMMDIVLNQHNYRGYVGIEYEGEKTPEMEGIRATKKLLERVRDRMKSSQGV